MKIKLFGRENTKSGLEVLSIEDEVNAWLATNPNIKIERIAQSSNGGSWATTKLFISIWYEETT